MAFPLIWFSGSGECGVSTMAREGLHESFIERLAS
jgi:hypothetical protein